MDRVLPAGYVSLSTAWLQLQTQHPDYAGDLPPVGDAEAESDWHARHNEVIGRLESLLLDALSNDELREYVLIRGRDGTWTEHRLPREYWRDLDGNTPGFAASSFATGDVVGMILTAADRHLDGAPLVLREQDWLRWLERVISAATTNPAPTVPDAFGVTFWTLIQSLAWVFLRNRDVVQQVAGDARLSRQYYAEVSLPDGQKVMAAQNAGPATDLTLDLHAAAGAGARFTNTAEAGEAILERMRAGELVGYGRENGHGAIKEIPPISIIDGKLHFSPDQIRPRFATMPSWQDVRFKRADVMALWPTGGDGVQPSTHEEAGERAENVKRRRASEEDLKAWYQQRIKDCEAAGERPSRTHDEQAARKAFGPGLSRRVREIRRKCAPASWKSTGNKGHKVAARSGKE